MQIIFIIQIVQDTVIHLEVDGKEQSEITHGRKRQAERTGFLAQYLSGLRHTDVPHTWTQLWSRVDQIHKRKEYLSVKVTKQASQCNAPYDIPEEFPKCPKLLVFIANCRATYITRSIAPSLLESSCRARLYHCTLGSVRIIQLAS